MEWISDIFIVINMEENIEAKYTRDINCLREKDKNTRINGLKRLLQSLPNEPQSQLQQLFALKLKQALLDLLKDPADKCKELSVSLLSYLVNSQAIQYDDIPAVLTTLHSRLAAEPCPESCEEVRVIEIQLLLDIMEKYTSNLPLNMAEITDILSKQGKDRCPQVKNSVSAGIIFLCTSGLRFSCKKLLEGIRANLTHQQYKVRSSAIEAIGALGLNESGIAEELYIDFKKSQVDRRAEVKQIAYATIKEILTHIAYPDLKKIEGKYVYLLLGGLGDEDCAAKIPEYLSQVFARIRKSAEEYSEDCSEAISENWLAVRNLKDIIDLGLADIQEWTIQDYYRSRAVNNIGSAAVMAGSLILPHLERILKVFFKAHSGSEDTKYQELLESVAKSMSQFIEFSEALGIFNKLFLEPLSAPERCSGLVLYGNMISSLDPTPQNLDLVVSFFTSKDFTTEPVLFTSLHFCISELLNSFGGLVAAHLSSIFYLLLTLENTLKSAVHPTVTLLANCCGYPNMAALYSLQLPMALPKIIANHRAWEGHSTERIQFRNLATRAGPGIQDHWASVLEVLAEGSKREKETEIRYDMMVILESIAGCRELDSCIAGSSDTILSEIISPTCAWKVGASSVQVRIASLLCFRKLLEAGALAEEALWRSWGKYFEGLSGCMEDDWDGELRIAAVNCVRPLLEKYGGSVPKALLEQMQKELMKRLDDSVDAIRVACTGPLKMIMELEAERGEECESFGKNVRVLFLHLDDENKNLQNGVSEVLRVAMDWKMQEVCDIAREKKEKQRHPERIDWLMQNTIKAQE